MKLAAAILILVGSGRAADDELSRAQALHRNGRLAQARLEYDRVLGLAKTRRDNLLAGKSLQGLAQVDLNLGHYSDCINEATAALGRFRATAGKAETEAEGRVLTTLGQAHYFAGDSTAAIVAFEQGLVIAKQTGDAASEVTRLNNIGNVYSALGRYGDAFSRYREAENRVDRARDREWFSSRRQLTEANLAVLYQRLGQYDRALRIYKDLKSDPRALPPGEQAQLLANMGTLYRRLGDPVTALEQYRGAQAIYHGNSLLAGETGVLNDIGIVEALDLHEMPGAVRAFTHSLQMNRKAGGKRLMMTSLLYRGETFLLQSDPEKARADFAAAGLIANELDSDDERWRADYGLARVAALTGNLNLSNERLSGAIATIERMRGRSNNASGRMGFLIERRDVYDLLIEHQASLPNPNPAAVFRLMERSRARVLQEAGTSPKPEPDLAALTRRLSRGTLLLQYWLGQQSLAVLEILNGETRLHYRRFTERERGNLLGLPAILADASRGDWREKAVAAATLLLGDLNNIGGRDIRRVIVVPDAELARIPFEVLPWNGSPLIGRFSVSYLPYGTAWTPRNRKRQWVLPWKTSLLAFANPEPGAGRSGMGIENADLPKAETEVRNVAAASGGRVQIYLGRQALKQHLTEAAGASASVIHFATHAFADPEDPERSWILFAGQREGFDYLFLKEAAGLNGARGKLVTVSACDSGTGRIARGEGIQSFSSAFLMAGARSVVTSLWRVGDRPAAELMSRFYASLAAGEDAGEALRSAKLQFIRTGGTAAHPAYWAAFVLAGDESLQIPRVVPWTWLAAALLGLVSGVSLAVFKIRGGKA